MVKLKQLTGHSCFYCGYSKYVDHMESHHADKKVDELNEDETTKGDKDDERLNILTMLRNKGNRVHNLNVKEGGKGFC